MSASAKPESSVPVEEEKESKKPDDTAFKQQRLPAWQPVMSPPYVIGCFMTVALIFIPLGAGIIVTSDQVQELSVRYDHLQACPFDQRLPQYNYACRPQNFTMTITKTMKAPVYIYYRLDNFYQNHRRYAKSRSDLQLAGEVVDKSSLTDCEPFTSPGQYLQPAGNTSIQIGPNNGDVLDITSVTYSPCGLIPWSMFNDTFILSKDEGSTSTLYCNGANFNSVGDVLDPSIPMKCSKKGIAWPSDIGVKYASQPTDPTTLRTTLTYRGWPTAYNNTPLSVFAQNGWYLGEVGHRIPDPVDEDLMVWSRLASLSTFRKLYRRIDVDLEPGTYFVTVLQRYDLRSFGGKKYFVLSTTSWIGGQNYFLGGLYVATGCLCFMLGAAFLAKHITTPRRVGSL